MAQKFEEFDLSHMMQYTGLTSGVSAGHSSDTFDFADRGQIVGMEKMVKGSTKGERVIKKHRQ